MCDELKICRSSYYKWLNSKPSLKIIEDNRIISKIKEIASSNNSLFGVIEMYYALRALGYKCGHNRVYRLMCINDIKSAYRAKPKYNFKQSTPEATAENILARDFNTYKKKKKWCTDVTEIVIPGTDKKLYISSMIDLYDRYPISLEVSEHNDTKLANDTLIHAHEKYPKSTPLVHSDRGFAYTRTAYQNMLKEFGMTQSMSRISKCIDNGVCEGFQGQFKDMLWILYPNIRTKEAMISAIYGTLDYYINHYPQKRLNGKTIAKTRKEALSTNNPIQYNIHKSNKYIKFWEDIELKKQRAFAQMKKEENALSSF